MKNKTVEILLVEDSLYDAEMTIRALKKINIVNTLIHLKDGSEGLDFIFCKGEFSDRDKCIHPKVILLDLKMPKVDGMEFLQKIKSDPETQNIPVVVLTSSNEDPDIKRCYELGVNSYIVKPVEYDNFTKAVADLGLYWLLLNQTPK